MALSWNEIRDRARKFSKEWADEASEDAEAKSFWNDFFNIFGVNRRRVATFEHRVKKVDGKDGYIDLLWKGMLLVEHKSKGKDLDRAHRQAKDYFHGLKDSELPRYVLVSDFERFRLYDYEKDAEYTEFHIKDLHKHVRQFGFLAGYTTHSFKEEDPVNIQAAEKMGKLHDALKVAGYEGHALEVLLVRLLFCLFADDTSIFEPRQFHELIVQRTSEDGADLGLWLAQLFQVLNTPTDRRQKTLDEQLADFPYVNGKLFEEVLPLSNFNRDMRELLLQAADLDWSRISPAIFGSLFQSVMDAKLRRNLGAHYTSEKNILKVIKPLFLDDLYEEFEKVKGTPAKLKAFHMKLSKLRFMDPACGCGNFLVIAYRELRLLELDVLKALFAKQDSLLTSVSEHVAIDVDQFYGIEIEEFPAQIAQVALWLMDHQLNLMVSEHFGEHYARLPLVKSATIVHGNALRLDWDLVCPREKLSYILGNPPFIGHHLQSEEQKADMLACYDHDKSAGVMDFVSAWYCKAARYLTVKGEGVKVALVSTNSITQGEQVGIMWRNLLRIRPLHIHFAHRTFKWSNEAKGKAAVYCVIIGFGATPSNKKPLLFDYESPASDPVQVEASTINAYLADAPWVLLENRSKNPFGMPEMMYGSKPTDNGHLLLTDDEKVEFLKQEPAAAPYIKPFLSAHEYLHGEKRWVMWLVDAEAANLKSLPKVMERVKAVDAFRKASKAASTREYRFPTLFRQVTQPKSDYILIPGHTSENRRYIPFGFFSKDYIVGNSCFSLPGSSLYHFGVISSAMHMAWVSYTCGRLKSDYRYSKDIVYNNYPWPESPSDKQKLAIEEAAQAVIDARAAHPASTLADLYDPLRTPPDLLKAHQRLDKAVEAAYGKGSFKTDGERVAFLFTLYQKYTSLLPTEPVKKTRRKATTATAD